jgi:O-acetylserine/cysteine efflux transporter
MPVLHIGLAVLVALIWGGNFVAAKFSVAYLPPFLVSALRFVLASALLIPFFPRPTLPQLGRIFIMAHMSAMHFSLLFMALQQGLDIASSALIGQLGVPFACVLGAIFLKDRIGIWRIAGIAIAFIGMAIVSGTPNVLEHPLGFWASVASAATWGIANVLVKGIKGVSSMSMLAWMSACTIPTLLLLSFCFEAWPPLLETPASALIGVSYTVLCSTLVAYGLWYFLLANHDVSQVTPFSLLTPVFGIAAGQLFFSETLTQQTIIGGFITIIGVSIIVLRRPKTIQMGEAT